MRQKGGLSLFSSSSSSSSSPFQSERGKSGFHFFFFRERAKRGVAIIEKERKGELLLRFCTLSCALAPDLSVPLGRHRLSSEAQRLSGNQETGEKRGRQKGFLLFCFFVSRRSNSSISSIPFFALSTFCLPSVCRKSSRLLPSPRGLGPPSSLRRHREEEVTAEVEPLRREQHQTLVQLLLLPAAAAAAAATTTPTTPEELLLLRRRLLPARQRPAVPRRASLQR